MTKEELQNYRRLKSEQDDLKDKIKEIDNELYSLRIGTRDGTPRGGAGNSYHVESLIDKKEKLKAKYYEQETLLTEKTIAIEELIKTLPSKERRLMRYHYIDGLTWESVCIAMNYSWSHVHRIHASALIRLGI